MYSAKILSRSVVNYRNFDLVSDAKSVVNYVLFWGES